MKVLLKILFVIIVLGESNNVQGQIVLNEVMINPGGAQGLLGTNDPTGWYYGSEYIEIYNAGCTPVDISGWMLANNVQPIIGARIGGSFSFPTGTIIQPKAHLVLGTRASSQDPNSIDFKTENFTPQTTPPNTGINGAWNRYQNIAFAYTFTLQNGSIGSRPNYWLLSNLEGWIALYNNVGVPQDAVYWSGATDQNLITTSAGAQYFADRPTAPLSYRNADSTLSSARQIFLNTPSLITWINRSQMVRGQSVQRIPDGGSWVVTGAPSINHAANGPNANCNGGVGECYIQPLTITGFSYQSPVCRSGVLTPNFASGFTTGGSFSAPSGVSINAATGVIDLSASASGTYSIKYSVQATGCNISKTDSTPLVILPAATIGIGKYDNVSCNTSCVKRGNSIVINEVRNFTPTTQGIIGGGAEYVELYNPTCSPIDISCYIIGTRTMPNLNSGSLFSYGGSIMIPQGTILQPKSHFVIGTSSSSSNPISVDFKTDQNTGYYCTTGNFVLLNGDGWLSLYDRDGIVLDAIYWTVSANQAEKIISDDDFDDSPCRPNSQAGCSTTNIFLQSAKQIFQTNPSKITYVGQTAILNNTFTSSGNTFSRIPDGGTWQREIAPSIDGSNCNLGLCDALFSQGNCNGAAIATTYGGGGSYSYTWKDAQNNIVGSTAILTNLCPGNYCVVVKDNLSSCTTSACVNIGNNNSAQCSPLSLIASKVNGQCGNIVEFPVRVAGFRNILSMQGSINWSPTDLRFESISSFGDPILAMNISNFGTTQISQGRLAFSWNDISSSGVTLPDTTTIFIIRFTALGTQSRVVPVIISNTPVPIEFADNNFDKQTAILVNGSVNLNCIVKISGRVITPLQQGVRNATVVLNGTGTSASMLTDFIGSYSFRVLPGTYTLTLSKNNEVNKMNGITTLDIALIQAHILQRSLLNSPYKIIAADANSSNTVTTIDIAHIRRLILGYDTTFPGNRTWSFVPQNHIFVNLQNPFPYPSSRTLTTFNDIVNVNFIGMKIGDVNYDRNPALDRRSEQESALKLYYEEEDVNSDEKILRVKVKEGRSLMGMQFTLGWNQDQFSYAGLAFNQLGVHIGDRWKEQGSLALSWNDEQSEGIELKTDQELFAIKLLRKTNAVSSNDILILNSDRIEKEAFDASYRKMNVILERKGSYNPQMPVTENTIKVYPNPVRDMLQINYGAATASRGEIRLLDMQGRIVYSRSVGIAVGDNRYDINLINTGISAGSYVLKLQSGNIEQHVKIVLVR